MTPQFDHHVVNSFLLWADNFLVKKTAAFRTVTTQLYPMGKDEIYADYYAYASPFKQWIADESLAGVTVGKAENVTLDGVAGDFDGIVDYENGRILSLTEYDGVLSLTYSVKEVNIYCPNENEEDVIFENNYIINSRFKKTNAGIDPYKPALPAILFAIQSGENEEFAFGGEDQTKIYAKGVVMTDDLFTLEGVLSAFRDSNLSVFNWIPFEKSPFDELGSTKGGVYNYEQLKDAAAERQFFIDRVVVSKLSDQNKNKTAKNLFVGFVDFTITTVRYPRA